MAIILFDGNAHQTLRPLTHTRPVADLRIGILTIAEKWAKHLKQDFSYQTSAYLSLKFPINIQAENLFINASYCPDQQLLEAINKLSTGAALQHNGELIAVKLSASDAKSFDFNTQFDRPVDYTGSPITIKYPEHLFRYNDTELKKDFQLLTIGRSSAKISSTNTIIGNHFFAEDGATAEHASFNTTNGPIYLDHNTEVWEGTHIRGSFALCHHSQVKMGAKIYGGTTVGPYCRVGGEIENVVIWGYSSKGHEGYLGNSVLGEWCNIGAGTNSSNLKNNYAEVKLWDYASQHLRPTGLQFCGLIMADHSKCAINTMFNTGTVIGVNCNIFGQSFPRNFVPDFSWGGATNYETYELKKALETNERVFARRDHRKFDTIEQDILKTIFELTHQ